MRREKRVEERVGSEKGEVEVTPQSGQRAARMKSTGQLDWAGGESKSLSITFFCLR